jgi:hypothetical protein
VGSIQVSTLAKGVVALALKSLCLELIALQKEHSCQPAATPIGFNTEANPNAFVAGMLELKTSFDPQHSD